MAESWREEWWGMPEYEHKLMTPFRSVVIHFDSEDDLRLFEQRFGVSMAKGRTFWFPRKSRPPKPKMQYVDEVSP